MSQLHCLCLQSIRCTVNSCCCESFTPGKRHLRYCENCHHGWVPHGKSINAMHALFPRYIFEISCASQYWNSHVFTRRISGVEKKEERKQKKNDRGKIFPGIFRRIWCRVRAWLNANFPTVSILHPTGPQGRNSIFRRWPLPFPRWASRPSTIPL